MSEHNNSDDALEPAAGHDDDRDLTRIEKDLVEKELEEVDPTIFQDVPDQAKERIVEMFVSMSHHEGPLPSVRTLGGYDRLIPNGADRIMVMAEKQQDHRMAMEVKVINAEISQSNLGQFLAFGIGLATLGTCAYCASIGQPILAGIIGSGGLIGLVTAFIQGKKRQEKDLEDKRPPEPEPLPRQRQTPRINPPTKKKKPRTR